MECSNQRFSNADMVNIEALHQTLLEELPHNNAIPSIYNLGPIFSPNLDKYQMNCVLSPGLSNLNLDQPPFGENHYSFNAPAPNIDTMEELGQQQEFISGPIILMGEYQDQYGNFQCANTNTREENMGAELNFLAQSEPIQSNMMGNIVSGVGNIDNGLGNEHAASASDLNGSAKRELVERRELRLKKNRESAARSRARKQAYTMELEIEQKRLKVENSRLKFEMERVQLKIEQEAGEDVENQVTKAEKISKKFKQLRRSSSMSC